VSCPTPSLNQGSGECRFQRASRVGKEWGPVKLPRSSGILRLLPRNAPIKKGGVFKEKRCIMQPASSSGVESPSREKKGGVNHFSIGIVMLFLGRRKGLSKPRRGMWEEGKLPGKENSRAAHKSEKKILKTQVL